MNITAYECTLLLRPIKPSALLASLRMAKIISTLGAVTREKKYFLVQIP